MAAEQELVERFQDSAQATMLRDVLKGNGFHPSIAGQGGMSGSGARLTGGYLVTVPKAEYHEVQKLLKRLEKEAFLHGEEEDPAQSKAKTSAIAKHPGTHDPDYTPEKCPHCGSKNIAEMESPIFFRLAVTILLLGLPLLFPKPRTWMCKDCEQHWP